MILMKHECDIKQSKRININKENDLRPAPSQVRDSSTEKKTKKQTGTSSSLSECEITHLQYLLCGKKGFKGLFKTVAKTLSTFLMPELNSGGR